MTLTDITKAILDGTFDAELNTLLQTINLRKDRKSMSTLFSIRIGDTIMFNHTCRPKYLRGVKATVRDIGRTCIRVDLDRRIGRFYTNVTVPLGIYSKI
jgi:hypothetical protein